MVIFFIGQRSEWYLKTQDNARCCYLVVVSERQWGAGSRERRGAVGSSEEGSQWTPRALQNKFASQFPLAWVCPVSLCETWDVPPWSMSTWELEGREGKQTVHLWLSTLSPGSSRISLFSFCLNFRSIIRVEKKMFFTESFAHTMILGEEVFLEVKNTVNLPSFLYKARSLLRI